MKLIFDANIEEDETYKGATVLWPKQGWYLNVIVPDAASLYPTVAILFNLSFDTINCQCCKDNPDAKISNSKFYEFAKDCIYINRDIDWICKRKVGAFPDRLIGFKDERLNEKRLGNKAKTQALKILINGGYGVFGSAFYKYYDPRVAELVTAAGRYILNEMEFSAEHDYGFQIIYGDTDSIFLYNTTDKLLLSKGKKHYIGLENGEIDLVGFESKKSDRCEFYHKVGQQVENDIMIHEVDPIPNVRKAFSDLEGGLDNPKSLIKGKFLEWIHTNVKMILVNFTA
jgi:DNA polymerase elongation subunit (family B)